MRKPAVFSLERIGYQWTEEPDQGVGPGQLGGWAFDIPGFMEQTPTRAIGSGLADQEKRTASAS